jgi:hypothetical protein
VCEAWFSLTHHWANNCKRWEIVTARQDAFACSFLGSIAAPVPSSRPGIVRATRAGGVKSAARGGTGTTRSRRLAASMARTHDLSPPARGASLGQAVAARQSVTAVAERWLHRSDGVQIEIDHLLQCQGGSVVAQAFRQGIEPRGTFGLHRNHLGKRGVPALGPAAPRRAELSDGDRRLRHRPTGAVDLMSVFGPGNRVKGSKPRLCRGPTRGAAHGTNWSVFCGGLSSFHSRTRGCRPEGVTRLAMCMIEGRAGWSGVEPQAQETGRGTAYTIYRHGRA